MSRPYPPEITIEDYEGINYFVPSPELDSFVRNTFLKSESKLYNEDHIHLLPAHIGYLWTNVPNRSKMRSVAGEAERPSFKGGAWQKNRQILQFQEWFGELPDFVITLDASYCNQASDAHFCALLEHELYHCAQALDEFGQPKFHAESGFPIFAMRDHDVSEFVGVIRRYGINVVANGEIFLQAAQAEPEIEALDVKLLCATCAR